MTVRATGAEEAAGVADRGKEGATLATETAGVAGAATEAEGVADRGKEGATLMMNTRRGKRGQPVLTGPKARRTMRTAGAAGTADRGEEGAASTAATLLARLGKASEPR
jgi:hypothetical protein